MALPRHRLRLLAGVARDHLRQPADDVVGLDPLGLGREPELLQERRRQQALKRGGSAGPEGARTADPDEAVALDEIVGAEPTPEFAVRIAEHFESLLARLPDEELRQIARLRLEEYSSDEIAQRLGCAERTVRRKLVLIRSYWENAGAP